MDLFELNSEQEEKVQTSKLFDKTKPNRIISVKYNNFRIIDEEELWINGSHKEIKGINGTGKTTHLEGIIFALSGNLLDGSSLTNLIPRDKEPDTLVSVEVKFESGVRVRREYQQKVKVDGTTGEKIIGSSTQTIFVDDVKQKSLKDGQNIIYNELGILELVEKAPKEINVIMLLLVANYFITIPNKTLRTFFEDMVGGIEPKEVFKGIQTTEAVVKFFAENGYDLDKIKTVANKKKQAVEIDVKSVEKVVSNLVVDDVELNALKTELDTKETRLKELDTIIQDESAKQRSGEDTIKNGIKLEISNIKLKIAEEEAKLKEEFEANKDTSLSSKIEKLKSEQDTLKKNHEAVKTEIDTADKEIVTLKGKLQTLDQDTQSANQTLLDLREEYKRVSKPQLITCPCCNKQFDLNTALEYKDIQTKSLETIKERGVRATHQVSEFGIKKLEIENDIKNQEVKKTALEAKLKEIYEKAVANQTAYKQLSSKAQEMPSKPILMNETIKDLTEQIKTLETNLNAIKLDFDNTLLVTSQSERETLSKEIMDLKMKLQNSANGEKEKVKLQDLRKELVIYEQALALVDKANKNKLVLLDEKVAKIFGDNIKIKLFDYNEDGGVKPILDILVKDKYDKFTTLFNGINDGYYAYRVIEITNIIRKLYNVRNSFVLVDGLESLDHQSYDKLKTLGQQIIGTEVVKQ